VGVGGGRHPGVGKAPPRQRGPPPRLPAPPPGVGPPPHPPLPVPPSVPNLNPRPQTRIPTPNHSRPPGQLFFPPPKSKPPPPTHFSRGTGVGDRNVESMCMSPWKPPRAPPAPNHCFLLCLPRPPPVIPPLSLFPPPPPCLARERRSVSPCYWSVFRVHRWSRLFRAPEDDKPHQKKYATNFPLRRGFPFAGKQGGPPAPQKIF